MMWFNNMLVGVTRLMPKRLVRVFAAPYIAGDTLQDAVAVTKDLNARGIMATMDVLGESIETKDQALEAKEECALMLDAIHEEKLDANVSVKPTQFGLLIDEEFCYGLLKDLVEKAKGFDNFIRLDMEDSPTTDKIIRLYKRLKAEYPNVGIVLQSYMRRTYDDAKELDKLEGANYRLCKGIYVEPKEIAYKGKQEVRDNFMKTLRLMLEEGAYVGIATHDKQLIERSYALVEELKLDKSKYEFQMLLGVREDARDQINADGHRIRIYTPYGKDWYAYSIRRLQENPNMAFHIVKNFFKRGK
jgi:proline dehydrogenase